MRIIFIFIDGFGIGAENSEKNPLYAADTPNLRALFKNYLLFPTDAALGVEGLPQSATGQTAIFTGFNASRILGRHLNGQPTITLKNLINKTNLFSELKGMGLKVTNANVYRKEYLEKMLDPGERRYKPSVTSVMTLAAGLGFRQVEDYNLGKGIYHDITGQMIRERGLNADLITPSEAAARLYGISREYDFTLFEHFMTDIIGHSMDMERAKAEMELLDAFLGSLASLAVNGDTILFITSDHGNIEDITVKTHTTNPVPTVIAGKIPAGAGLKIDSLTDIMPAVINLFKAGRAERM